MAITISIALQKGGVGKSTTSQALASTLGYQHKKVLLIDMDSQANITYSSEVDEFPFSMTDVLSGECSVNDAVIKCKYYDILPADNSLTAVERSDVDLSLLKYIVDEIGARYDYIVIDTPPALGNLSVLSLVASDYVIVTMDTRPYSMQGLAAFTETFEQVKGVNKSIKLLGILMVKYNGRTVLSKDLRASIEDYAKQIGTSVFDVAIRESVSVAEAQTLRKPLIEYAYASKPNMDYMLFTGEVLKRTGKQNE